MQNRQRQSEALLRELRRQKKELMMDEVDIRNYIQPIAQRATNVENY